MKDPFPIAPFPWLSKATQPFAKLFNLPTLPLHIHEVLLSALLYQVVFSVVSPVFSNLFVGRFYSNFSRNRRLNWDTHVVSMVQSVLINALALWVMFVDDERKEMGMSVEGRVWGYTGAAALIQAMGAGYFLWDLIITASNVQVFGLGTLAHAVAALIVYSMGFRPFVNYYSTNFILWELSTPFLNIHWFMDKVNMTGSKPQLYNGFLLLGSFFLARLVYGTYQSLCVLSDIWSATNGHPTPLVLATSPQMAHVTTASTVPAWLAVLYLVSNMTLNSLNFYWFFKMITAVRKRFDPKREPITEVGIEISAPIVDVAVAATGRDDGTDGSRKRT